MEIEKAYNQSLAADIEKSVNKDQQTLVCKFGCCFLICSFQNQPRLPERPVPLHVIEINDCLV